MGREQSGSEARLGELEKASAQADREKKRLTDSLEETRQETELLTTLVGMATNTAYNNFRHQLMIKYFFLYYSTFI